MKLGFDAKRLFNNFTGLGNYSRTLLKNLAGNYAENTYHLYTPAIKESEATLPFLQNPLFINHLPSIPFKSYWRTFAIRNQLIKDKIDLYHGLSNEIPSGLNHSRIKSVVTIHDLIFKVSPDTYQLADRLIYDYKFRYACQHADRIIAISENTKKDITEFYGINPDKIDVIYQACSAGFYTLKTQETIDQVSWHYSLPADYLLSVGSVEPRKNLKRVIEALSLVPRDLLLPLVVIGKGGKYKQEVRQLVTKSGLEKSVIWIDHLTLNDDLQSIYQNSKALIYTSLYEGFGLPVAEGLLSRTPVITSNRSSLPEAGGPATLYVDPADPEQIAAAIQKVLTDEALRNDMIDKGFNYANQVFSPETVTRQIISCYQKTVGGNA